MFALGFKEKTASTDSQYVSYLKNKNKKNSLKTETWYSLPM